MDKFEGMQPRSIGPAGMSGRVTAIDVVLSEPDIIYIGTASGGLWKSTSGGIDWQPIFDEQPVASIGAVAITQTNPDVIWVGTGEGNPRNSQTSGNGVYKSLDAGKTWTHLGLDNTRNSHRVIIHPENPDVVYVGAQGSAWGDTPDRGVYKTTDGGKTWVKILYVNDRTGIGDLIMDPTNPNKLIAAVWEFRRWPWFFKSGGPGSGIHVTFDGGETWEKRTHEDGLPKGELGRIGLAIARSNPDIVYALVEAKKNALYRSEDGGFTWKKRADKNIGNRPFYYAEIYVDPKNENRVYNLHSRVTMSEDGGKTFEMLVPFDRVHPDHHAWWIHPDDPNLIIDGNDGGLAISHDRGESWRFVENLPLAQFYHINVDMEKPYNVLGGMQDNGSWRGPSHVWRAGGIRNAYWEEVAFGDGFDVVPDRSNSRYGYAMSQGGFLRRYDLETGEQKLIRPIHPEGVELRFNWNAGIAHDPFSPTTIYYGSQFLHKSTDRGDTWQTISPDLTTNDPEKQRQLESGGLTYDVTQAENFTTIITIAPSPLQEGVIWVGTDDGNVQLTRDGGETWTNVVKNIKGVPTGTWVPQIRASTYNANEAFVVFDNHRRNDWTPYVYHTTNFGDSWERLADENDVWGYALAFAQDMEEPRLMFLGTEFGLYVSIDAGENWSKWTSGYPTVSSMDLVIHPREHDLVVGTFGRSAYILDDIRPLRALAREGVDVLEKPLHVFDIPDAVLAIRKQAAGTRFAAEGKFSGENQPYGAMITYVFNPQKETEPEESANEENANDVEETKADSVTTEVLDANGDVIRTLKAEAKPGVNRTTWGLRRKGVRSPTESKPKPGAPEPRGPQVLPGTYTVRISHAEQVDSASVNVSLDPRIEVSKSKLQVREEMIERLQEDTRLATEAVDRLRDARETIGMVSKRLKDREEEAAKELMKKGKALKDSIKSLVELINPRDVQGIRRDPEIVSAKLRIASFYVRSSWDSAGEPARIAIEQAEAALQAALVEVNAFFDTEWPQYQQTVDALNISFFDEYEPIRMEE
ncbi:hypothetical protein GWO43_23800 [candidate division KSB1 bacterium]|nr:hypothetical protein [candidate division KSB1 bacterium]NIR73294.1 hypothetical protein [candidate division KSB1 bacterium]NIS27000.1 hypothetical protein [candidate division KSB1 bacterium]NIT73840.1 hypothetical protein [candidate division KSB1 bacterium]NIU27745.1 hypothetical protein [candidate division KSB1 bacterium]